MSGKNATRTGVSVVLPVYNEKGNLWDLYLETKEALAENFADWEFVFVDDGSTDGSYEILRELARRNRAVKVIRFRTNFGQSAALDAGLKHATGEVVVTMDSDGQNDPGDIPKLVEKLDEGYDCVCGWRVERNDPFGKRVFSAAARRLRWLLLETELHDYGCTLKAFDRDAATELDIAGEMHRYIPPLLSWRGYRVGEVEVNHRPRKNGDTKYSWQRIPKGFVDLLNVWFWRKYSSRPLHIFGGLGILVTAVGTVAGMYAASLKVVENVSLSDTALPLFAAFAILLGIQFFISGILADISSKNYFAVREMKTYRIQRVISDEGEDEPESMPATNEIRSSTRTLEN